MDEQAKPRKTRKKLAAYKKQTIEEKRADKDFPLVRLACVIVKNSKPK